MATITIRNLDESVKKRLRVRAASHERSMEEEVRIILKTALEEPESDIGLGTSIHQRFAETGIEELPLPSREESPRKADLVT